MTGRTVSHRLAEFEPRLIASRRASPGRRANVVALHPAAIAIYFDAIEQLTNALSANDTTAACFTLLEFIDGIVVALRVKPGDPMHLKARGDRAALM